ncbi:hypothetical protein [Streptomyces albogriseolus]|uniref:hypothetical protein n=1 Tax=Streptomyces albogriseolus TaxID=1887 RepID=UPI0016761CDA|nr:hypothetical protein [Streptomyces viridodiastaticus]
MHQVQQLAGSDQDGLHPRKGLDTLAAGDRARVKPQMLSLQAVELLTEWSETKGATAANLYVNFDFHPLA